MTTESDLPQPPPALLDLLQRLESRLDELDTVRDEVRTMREALEAAQTKGALVSAATINAIVTISATGRVDRPRMGSATGTLDWEGHAEGHAPTLSPADSTHGHTTDTAMLDDQPTREWLSGLQKRGGQAAKFADVITRVIYIAAKLGEVL